MDVEPGGNLQPGTSAQVTATVDAGGKTWPGDIADCAQVLLNVKLPEPGDAQGSEATFSVDDYDKTITYGQTATTVDAAQQAKLPFSTLPEDPALATGKETLHYVAFGVKVKRAQVGELTALIDSLLVGSLPEPVLSLVKLILGPVESAAREKLSELASVDGPVASLLTVRHEPPEDPPPVPPTPEETCAVGAAADGIPDGTWTGPIDMDVVGSGADMGGAINSAGGGTMTLTSAKGKVSGTWDIQWSSKGTLDEDGVSVKLAVNGKVDGTAAGKAVQPRLDYILLDQGHGHGEHDGHHPEGADQRDRVVRPVPHHRREQLRRGGRDLRAVVQQQGQPGRDPVQREGDLARQPRLTRLSPGAPEQVVDDVRERSGRVDPRCPVAGTSAPVRCSRTTSARSSGVAPNSSGRWSSRWSRVSRSTSRTKTSSKRSRNRAELREPPQNHVAGTPWSATSARTRSTSHRWCSWSAVSVGSPVAGSPW